MSKTEKNNITIIQRPEHFAPVTPLARSSRREVIEAHYTSLQALVRVPQQPPVQATMLTYGQELQDEYRDITKHIAPPLEPIA